MPSWRAVHALECLVLKDLEESALRLGGDVGDFVEEDAAAVGHLEASDTVALGVLADTASFPPDIHTTFLEKVRKSDNVELYQAIPDFWRRAKRAQ